MKLHVLLLTALPMCLAQFSIQGPSDGHRRAQGLKFSQEKGIEYTDQSDSEGPGDFSIQGATDGNSNFRIQGATDGHTNFQIQGAQDGGAATYNIPEANDGAYDANQGHAKALQYNDPSGYRVNWRSYERQARPQAEPQYAAQAAAPVPQAAPRQRAHRPQPQPQLQRQQQPEPVPVYKPYANAPTQIQQLLQYQQQIPYINVIPEQYRFDEEAAIRAQSEQVREHYRKLASQPAPETEFVSVPAPAPQLASAPAPAPAPRQKPRGRSRQKREANPQGQQQPARQPQYSSQPPAEPQPHYSPNLPQHLQDLLRYQAQTPYNIIANQIVSRPDKPYVPHRVDAPVQQPAQQPAQQPVQQQPQYPVQQPQYPAQQPQVQQAQYQGQGGAYEAQASYTQARFADYNQGPQLQQFGYNQQQAGVRPVTENQY